MTTYRHASKDAVRETMLTRAVQLLTVRRLEASVVRLEEVQPTVEWFGAMAVALSGSSQLLDGVRREFENWSKFHQDSIGTRKPETLKVLYLCGPEPLNDLEVLLANGISSHNVWAVTSGEDYVAAVAEVARSGILLKIHPGSLSEFFEQFNESFDIIYFDACGPLSGGKPNTLDPLVHIFQRERLRSPGVLITNFCQPPSDPVPRNRYVDLITSYFSPRYRDLPRFAHREGPDPAYSAADPEVLRPFVAERVDEFYSDFVTQFVVDLAMNIVPYTRALSIGALSRLFLPSSDEIKRAQETLDFAVNPGAYSLVTFFRRLLDKQPNDRILDLLVKPRDRQQRSMLDNLELASLLSKVMEGHWGLLNEKMRNAVCASWFDLKARITCDVPLPNLTINSLLGVYGRPWFANTRSSVRRSYQAKTQRMYCDLLSLDQCRSFFDWFPVIEAVPTRFESIPFQVVVRCVLDRLGRDNFSCDSHPFQYASVVARGELTHAGWYDFSERVWV